MTGVYNQNMGLRQTMLFTLLVTVLAPIVLYSDFTSSSSRNQYLGDLPTLAIAGRVKPLHVLSQESSTALQEQWGSVYSEKSTEASSSYSSATLQQSAHIARQLTAAEGRSSTSSSVKSSDDNNQSIDYKVTDAVVKTRNRNSREVKAIEKVTTGVEQNDVKYETTSQHYEGKSENNTEKLEEEERVMRPVHIYDLKDQLIRGNIYLSLPATRSNPQFIRELRTRMKDVTRLLGDATNDSELPENAFEKLKALEQTLSLGKQIHDNCATVVRKLRAMLHLADDQLRVNKKQTLFLTHLTARTVPKGLHCLPLRIANEYFRLDSSQQHFPNKEKVYNPNLYHYAMFTDNVLAAAVVVNSTITHAKDPSKHVFHIVTDRINYAPMKMWFLANLPGQATLQVQNVEEFPWLNSSYSAVLRQLGSTTMINYYFKDNNAESDSNFKFRNPKYLSVMNHLRFYLPEIFPKLKKVLFLDDDVVVQKDLTDLWSIDLKGKVIGVVETCGKHFHRYDRYLNFSNPLISKNFNPSACGWAFGMNIFDLDQWRKQNLTGVYHKWQNLNHDRLLWKLGTLPPGLITFWNQTYTLDKSWHVLGLGYNQNVSQKDIEQAAVIHYNGNLKPWLDIAIAKFKMYWTKYLNYDHQYLRECNITP